MSGICRRCLLTNSLSLISHEQPFNQPNVTGSGQFLPTKFWLPLSIFYIPCCVLHMRHGIVTVTYPDYKGIYTFIHFQIDLHIYSTNALTFTKKNTVKTYRTIHINSQIGCHWRLDASVKWLLVQHPSNKCPDHFFKALNVAVKLTAKRPGWYPSYRYAGILHELFIWIISLWFKVSQNFILIS